MKRTGSIGSRVGPAVITQRSGWEKFTDSLIIGQGQSTSEENREFTFTDGVCHDFFRVVTETEKKTENPWLNLGFNLIIPSILLIKGNDWFGDRLSSLPFEASTILFVVALAFPLGYGIYDFVRRRTWNFLSILGIVGVLLTGGIGLLKLPPEWVAVKEAMIPGILGVVTLVSAFTKRPLVRVFLYRPEIFQVEKIQERLDERKTTGGFEVLMRKTTWLLAASFLLSAFLNFFLAKWIVVSPAGTEAFNKELGRMMAWSYPVIVVPSLLVTGFALWMCFRGLKELTGLTLEELIEDPKAKKS